MFDPSSTLATLAVAVFVLASVTLVLSRIIPDEYDKPFFRNIVLAVRNSSGNRNGLRHIDPTHAAYCSLHYVMSSAHGCEVRRRSFKAIGDHQKCNRVALPQIRGVKNIFH